MLSTLLILLGSVLLFIVAMLFVVLMIAGSLKRSVDILVASGSIGLSMVALGVLARMTGDAVLLILIPLILLSLAILYRPVFNARKVRQYFSREQLKPLLIHLRRAALIVAVMIVLDVVGLGLFLFSKGNLDLLHFLGLLTILLLLEGSLIGVAGALSFVGYSEYRISGSINPAVIADQRQRWRERRLSQQKWGTTMLIAGALLICLGLLVSMLTPL